MPSFSSKVDLSASAKSSNIVLADVDLIKGAFKVYTSSDLSSTNVNYFSDGQIVYVSDSGSLYRANVTLANPGLGIFSDSVSFNKFSFDSGSFTSASFNSGNSTLTFFGSDLPGSAQISMSVDLSDLSGGGSTDISDLNTFTGSAETRLDDLEAATGSYLVTGSVSENIITLEKADGSSFSLTVDTGSGGTGATQDLQSVLTAGNKASGAVILENDNSSGKLGLFLHADPSLSYNYTASISILNNGSLETGLGGTVHERITPNRGSTVLLQFTASNSVAFTGIGNEEQSYVLGYDSVTGNVTYFDTSSFGGGSGTVNTGSAHFITGVLKSGLFRLTGSVYSTANDVAITGSLDVNFTESDQEFRISSQSITQFSINNEGVAVLAPRSAVPTAVSGGMYFSTDGNFYFGIQQ